MNTSTPIASLRAAFSLFGPCRVSVFVAIAATGCSGSSDETYVAGARPVEEPAEHGDLVNAQQPLTDWRDDYAGTITIADGPFGAWMTDSLYCSPGSYAHGYAQRVERDQGSGDDTAMNTVSLLCANASGEFVEWATPHDGFWGDWGSEPTCSGFVTGARLKVEGDRGSNRDDTGANGVEMSCSEGGTIQADNTGPWGEWSDWEFCPPSSYVCGLKIKIEANRGSRRDDTAMNGLELNCCH